MMNTVPPNVLRTFDNKCHIDAAGLAPGLKYRVIIKNANTGAVVHNVEYTVPPTGNIVHDIPLPDNDPYEVTIIAPSSPSIPPLPMKGTITKITWEYLI
jgi:hypothetical protein